ncbi:MAG: twin-arginine translocase TatA/TatE family subunit [Isosphaeraceae bacterium]
MTLFGFFGTTFGGPEILIVGFIALLFFGNRLPGVMRSLGKSVTEFKKGVTDISDDIDKAVTQADKPTTKHDV